MKTPILNRKNLVSILTILGFTVLIAVVLPAVPASAIDFEIGTQFGISHLVPDVDDDYAASLTYTRVPSGSFFDISATPPSIYATWFLGQHFAIGPEFSFGRTVFHEDSEDFEDSWEENTNVTSLYFGGRAAYFLRNSTMSSPYVLTRVSMAIFHGEGSLFVDGSVLLTSFGAGLGYQWRIGPAFVLRTEGQYQRVSLSFEDDFNGDETANEFSFSIGIGTRFGTDKF
jgi:hypothetical protein